MKQQGLVDNVWRCGCFLAALLFMIFAPNLAYAARLKDIADIEGVRGNQLFGFGVVVGLNGTGDGGSVEFTSKSVSNLLEKLGIRVDPESVKIKNVASVIVTANLPAFARAGSKIDVTLSSVGNAKSLQGGTLLMTPLRGADGNVYAVAQGAVAVGGFAVEGGGDAAIKNHPTVGSLAEGAIIERSVPFDIFQSKRVRIVLRTPDFTTVTRVAAAIDDFVGRPITVALDGAAVEVPLNESMGTNPITVISKLELLEVEQDVRSKVVVNERTGTVIMGENVRISKVALAHGNINIVIRNETQVSQPTALSEGGQTAIVNNTDLNVAEDNPGLNVVGGEVSLGQVVDALNSLGATPRDLISIFMALKRAGALHADLEIM